MRPRGTSPWIYASHWPCPSTSLWRRDVLSYIGFCPVGTYCPEGRGVHELPRGGVMPCQERDFWEMGPGGCEGGGGQARNAESAGVLRRSVWHGSVLYSPRA